MKVMERRGEEWEEGGKRGMDQRKQESKRGGREERRRREIGREVEERNVGNRGREECV